MKFIFNSKICVTQHIQNLIILICDQYFLKEMFYILFAVLSLPNLAMFQRLDSHVWLLAPILNRTFKCMHSFNCRECRIVKVL